MAVEGFAGDLGLAAEPLAARARTNVLGVGVDPLTIDKAVAMIEDWIARRQRTYVTTCTVATVMQSRRSQPLREVVNGSGLVTPDGMPIVWLLRLAKAGPVTQVCGPDLLPALAARSAVTGARHYFYGGAEGVAERLAEKLGERFPGLEVAGVHSPPLSPVYQLATDETAARINAARPDIVWVGIGNPKQEHWMLAMRDRLEAPVLIGVGAAFDFHSGRLPRAPHWLTVAGLEWAFRLGQEPRRLWRRYLLDNPAFLYLVAMQLLVGRTTPLD